MLFNKPTGVLVWARMGCQFQPPHPCTVRCQQQRDSFSGAATEFSGKMLQTFWAWRTDGKASEEIKWRTWANLGNGCFSILTGKCRHYYWEKFCTLWLFYWNGMSWGSLWTTDWWTWVYIEREKYGHFFLVSFVRGLLCAFLLLSFELFFNLLNTL